jgi:hypothetical protein
MMEKEGLCHALERSLNAIKMSTGTSTEKRTYPETGV